MFPRYEIRTPKLQFCPDFHTVISGKSLAEFANSKEQIRISCRTLKTPLIRQRGSKKNSRILPAWKQALQNPEGLSLSLRVSAAAGDAGFPLHPLRPIAPMPSCCCYPREARSRPISTRMMGRGRDAAAPGPVRAGHAGTHSYALSRRGSGAGDRDRPGGTLLLLCVCIIGRGLLCCSHRAAADAILLPALQTVLVADTLDKYGLSP